jgi:hypothetical protein
MTQDNVLEQNFQEQIEKIISLSIEVNPDVVLASKWTVAYFSRYSRSERPVECRWSGPLGDMPRALREELRVGWKRGGTNATKNPRQREPRIGSYKLNRPEAENFEAALMLPMSASRSFAVVGVVIGTARFGMPHLLTHSSPHRN